MSSNNNTNPMLADQEKDYILYAMFHYMPSRPLACVGIAVFVVLFLYLVYSIRRRPGTPKFMIRVPTLAIFELVAFALRLQVINNPETGTFTAMSIFLLIPSNLLSLANYSCLVHIIKLANLQSEKFYYQPGIISKIFTASTLVAAILQATGGGLIFNASSRTAALVLLFLGLAFQLIILICYAFTLNHVHSNPKFDYHVLGQYNPKRKAILVLYITTSALIVRNVYRIAQYGFIAAGQQLSDEWAFYVFDPLMTAICFVVFGLIPNFFPNEQSRVDHTEAIEASAQSPSYSSSYKPNA
ncbi:hypothetical protein RMATCC62417_16121 [Rhizopus microsporus]|nr:hypothetical protein RMATCC62417_16121 [Rhizopus microsporus]